ncbi:hypothetical protein SUGI_0454340 [Cryptomeria japonica]|nr:hypothetical protein SUGI_0454340 [Cryptomeria japonica]
MLVRCDSSSMRLLCKPTARWNICGKYKWITLIQGSNLDNDQKRCGFLCFIFIIAGVQNFRVICREKIGGNFCVPKKFNNFLDFGSKHVSRGRKMLSIYSGSFLRLLFDLKVYASGNI